MYTLSKQVHSPSFWLGLGGYDPATEQGDLESGKALRELEEAIMQSANTNNASQQTENKSGSNWISIAFLLLVIVLVIIGVRRSILVYKRKFRNASDNFSYVRNQFNRKN